MKYARLLTPAVKEALSDTPVVIILGPRQSGKTTLAKEIEPQRTLVTMDANDAFVAARDQPDDFIDALPERVIIDEIQKVPALLPAIKRSVDFNRKAGRFLLTGSANLLMLPKVTESLAGRMEIVQLQPLCEAEKSNSSGKFLARFLDGELAPRISQDEEVVAFDWMKRVMEGGYPEPLTRSAQRARQWHRQYIRGLLEQDVQDIMEVRNSAQLINLTNNIALRTSTLVNVAAISNAMGITRVALERYLDILEKLFLYRRLPAWHTNASRRLVKTPKLHVTDTGLAFTLCELTPDNWTENREQLGRLLESFVVQQLMTQAPWTDPDLRFWHYRDKDAVEVDLVITLGKKVWGIEVKSARSVNEKDTSGLQRFANLCGENFVQGLVLHTGHNILPLKDKRLLAVPLRSLWEY